MIVFASSRALERAENIKAVYDSYKGEKAFCRLDKYGSGVDIRTGRYDLLVTDEYPSEAHSKVLMINHGITGAKLSGLLMPHPYITDWNSKLLTYATTSGKDMIDIVARECGIDRSRVVPTGMPRTDAYIGKHKGDGHTFLAKKRSYLFVPTFRGIYDKPMPDIDWKLIDDALSDDEVFVVKAHMLTGCIVGRPFRHIVEIFGELPSTPYLIDSDVVITDYSSIMLDAMLLDKPVVLFGKDKSFLETRGMNFKYPDDYSSMYCTNETDLVQIIRQANAPDNTAIDCRNRLASACDGHATKRVLDLMESML